MSWARVELDRFITLTKLIKIIKIEEKVKYNFDPRVLDEKKFFSHSNNQYKIKPKN